jgi:hypothetical protein
MEQPNQRSKKVASSNSMKAVVLKEVASFTGRPEVYQIKVNPGGALSCSCPAWRFAKKEQRPYACKHMRASGFGATYEVLLA